MRDFKIYTDSTSDLPGAVAKQMDITVVPTEFFVGGRGYLDYPDEREFSKKEFYGHMRAGEMPTTSVIPPVRFYEYFERDIKEGFDILYIVFSSGLSTTMQNALVAAEDLRAVYPESNVVVVDSLCASLGEGLVAFYAAKLKKEGHTLGETARWIENNRLRVCHWFSVDDLQHLRRGGRVSAVSAAVGGMLGIKPIIYLSDEGKLEPVEKVRGRKAALETLVNKVRADAVDPSEQTIFITNADCEEDCEWLKEQIIKETGTGEVITGMMGPVIGAHTGPGTLGLAFLGNNR